MLLWMPCTNRKCGLKYELQTMHDNNSEYLFKDIVMQCDDKAISRAMENKMRVNISGQQ